MSERKRIQIVDYRGSKALTTTAIEDELKKKDAALKIDTFYDPAKARRVEAIIKEMLAEKGRPFATREARRQGGGRRRDAGLLRRSTDGPKARVKEIEFEGNQVFSDGRLRGQMKKVKAAGFWNLSWLGGQDDLHRGEVDGPAGPGDQGRLRGLLPEPRAT